MRHKICQIIPTLVQGGAEKQMSLLAQHLPEDEFESHVIVLTHSGPRERELADSPANLHFIEKKSKLDLGAYFRLQNCLRDIKPDLVHTWLFAANSYGRVAARRAGVPAIVAGERCVDPWKTRWHHWIDRWLSRNTDAIVTNTSAITDFYAQHGIRRDLFQVIPNAVIPPKKKPITKAELCERLGLPARAKVVGIIGRLWAQKGYKDLIWASEILRAAYEDVIVVIIGDGPDREKLMHYRDKIHVHKSVRFAGHREDASELMSAFDVMWNGSLYEGQSNTLLEAMSYGIPVVASDIPGNRSVVVENETGYFYQLGDIEGVVRKTIELFLDDSKRAEFGENARKRIEQEFTLEKMVQSHAELYRQLIQSKAK